MVRSEVKICGFGGQGIVTLGRLIAFAAYISGKAVVQTIAYGQESRGGSAWADVVIDDEEVDYPKVLSPDVLILFSQEGVDKFGKIVKDNGKVLYDPVTVPKLDIKKTVSTFPVPATTIALKEFKSGVVANSIMYGAFAKIGGLIQEDEACRSLESILPKRVLELNMKAFRRGVETASELFKR
jgi:2-oxoglutarate ferredoxin oxidoreductase subunit gamma